MTIKLLSLFLVTVFLATSCLAQDRPNIILIMTDDQGIGDLGVTGNPFIETPNIDRLAGQSTSLTNFYVHPVCTPTRACLMTGRYNYRTRAIDTYIGRAMMEPDEVTIAEVLRKAGYMTGIFGKWHLGDCYPMRAIDQGFETAVIHRGGGIGQPSDPLDARRKYTDPILFRNGVAEQFQGYCTDIYYNEAIKFIETSREARLPYFVYLPDNTPHGPFHDVPQDLYQHYLDKKIDRSAWGRHNEGNEFTEKDADFLARVFAMIGNVDRNVGKLLDTLDEMELSDNTIVIFMCDNGPNSKRYVAGYRGNKASVYEGGIRSPFFIRWPKRIAAGQENSQIAAHIDLLPTLMGLSEIDLPADIKFDGADLSPSLLTRAASRLDRSIFIQTHRGDQPTRYHHMAVRNNKWKLVHPSGFGKEKFDGQPKFELYDMMVDPKESRDLATQHPKVVQELKAAYDKWFDDVSSTRPDNYAPPRIVIDAAKENPVVLSRQDWRRTSEKGWGNKGVWLIRTDQPTTLNLNCRLLDKKPSDEIFLVVNGRRTETIKTDENRVSGTFKNVKLGPGDYEITAMAQYEDQLEGVFQIEITSQQNR